MVNKSTFKYFTKLDDGTYGFVNQTGLHINHKYGFGLVDAGASVKLALLMANFPSTIPYPLNTTLFPEMQLIIKNITVTPSSIPDGSGNVEYIVGVTEDFLVEHIQLITTINHDNIGQLRIEVTSPQGTNKFNLDK